ncbi:MAG: TetR/AcrR family transcriptional regulator [Thermoleophilia bacterium]
MAESPPSRSRTGRPRADGRVLDREPRDEILAVAGRLFAERGVAATTMSEIARRSGLRQSSVYYYFRDKEAVLEEILSSVNRVILDHLARIQAQGGPIALRLYRMIRLDVVAICAFPYDINELYRLSALQEERFRGFWAERRELNRQVEALIAEGVAAGELRAVDPRLAALTLLANDEATQNWHRPVGAAGQIDDDDYEPARIAEFTADLALGGLLVDRDRLPDLRVEADRLDPL